MATIPIRELSHHTARSLALVKAGEPVDITERGKVIGKIVPVNTSNDSRAALIAAGRMEPGSRSRGAMLADVRRRLASAEQHEVDAEGRASSALQALRDDDQRY